MRKQIGNLSCLVREGNNEGWNIVLLHGFGADASDLYPLADFLDPDENWNIYFPDAPLEVPIGPHMMGRGWFPISVRDLETGVDFTKVRPPGLDPAAEMISSLLFELNSKKLILGGFSQGAMIATEVALHSPEDVSGLIILSGAMLDEENWTKKSPGLKTVKILQAHGQHDTVLPFVVSQRLNEMLKKGGAEIDWIPFSGGHEIPMPVLMRAKQFIAKMG
jgi:phospholipase/carboxylesterase